MRPGWRCRERVLPVHERVHVMGILNVTPDSFSDGGLYRSTQAAVARGIEMAGEGADIIDVGGESTRPGAEPVSAADECDRVLPVIEGLVGKCEAAVSIDTTKAAVAEEALRAGAVIVNDVSAMRRDRRMAGVAAAAGAGVVLMHMQNDPATMQQAPHYENVLAEVKKALLGWAEAAEQAGVAPESIVIDPGIGFGKTLEHNLSLMRGVGFLVRERYPVLLGPSRKSFLGAILGRDVHERLAGTAAAVAWAVAEGVRVVRVHDVAQMRDVVQTIEAICGAPE